MNERRAFVGRSLLRAMRETDCDLGAAFVRLDESLTGRDRKLAQELQRELAASGTRPIGGGEADPLRGAIRSTELVRENGGRPGPDLWADLEINLAAQLELEHSLARSMNKALVLSIATALVALSVGATYLLFVLPQFAYLFSAMNAELPPITRGVLTGFTPGVFLSMFLLIVAVAITLLIRPGWLNDSRGRRWNPLQLVRIALRGGRVADDYRMLLFVEYAAALVESGLPGRRALSIAGQEAGIFLNYNFESAGDTTDTDPLPAALVGADRLGQLHQELAAQRPLRVQALLLSADRAQLRTAFFIRTLLYVLVSIFIIAMYQPIFELGAAI